MERLARTGRLVSELHAIVDQLEELYPGRRFTPDGHLVGSLGEVTAAVLFDIKLLTASSTGHDALAADGRRVEIKATYGRSGIGIRKTSGGVADSLLVLKLSKVPEKDHEVVYNGPFALVYAQLGQFQSNGAAVISLSRLRELNSSVPGPERVPLRPH
ncbi:DUF6998 domain-containing protein [Corynebacterium halotolerans]|uniref:DUF6998 domain-containing protein n=1 Tax=Corynebacterium halotolerans TaxID=225326 RepID=UPI003CEC6364